MPSSGEAQSFRLEQTSVDLRVLAHHVGTRKQALNSREGPFAEGRRLLRVVQDPAYLTRKIFRITCSENQPCVSKHLFE